jgi:prophage regulatory protein
MSIASTGRSDHERKRILRVDDLVKTIGLSRTTIWRLVRCKLFPQPITLSERAIGWDSAEIDSWIATRAAARRKGAE